MVLHSFGTLCLLLLAGDSIWMNRRDARSVGLAITLAVMVIWALWS